MTKVVQKLFTASDAAFRASGIFIPYRELNPGISSVSVDSRTVCRAGLFIALKGEVTDGHNYIAMAFKRGASAVMISDDYYTNHRNKISSFKYSGCLIVVENTLLGLHKLAASWVAGFDELIKIAVTGSNGKSTTKEIIGSILSQEKCTIINEGNLNSEIGLSLSVFRINANHKYGVFEMGINHLGEMKRLSGILKPHYAIITNIGTAHIGLMGSEAAIAEEKSDIFLYFGKNNRCFIYENDPWANYLQNRCQGITVLYGLKSTVDIQNISNLGLDGWKIVYKGIEISLKLLGRHNLTNAIAAISLADTLGVSPSKIKVGLEKMKPLNGRSQIFEGRFTIIEDSYNASSESISEMLVFISELEWPGRIVLVLGSMKELGNLSEEAHRSVGLQVAELKPEMVFFFGEEMKKAHETAETLRHAKRSMYTSNYYDLKREVVGFLEDGDLLLLKGSRAMNLDKLAREVVQLGEVIDV